MELDDSRTTPDEADSAENVTKSKGRRRAHHKSRHGCQQCKVRKIKCDETKPECLRCVRNSGRCSFLDLQPARYRLAQPSISDVGALEPETALARAHKLLEPQGFQWGAQLPPLRLIGLHDVALKGLAGHLTLPPLQGPLAASLTSNSSGQFDLSDMQLMWQYVRYTGASLNKSVPGNEKYKVWNDIIPNMAFKYDFLLHGILAIAALHLAYLNPQEKDVYLIARDKHEQTGIEGFRKAIASINSETCHACWAFSLCLSMIERPGNLFSFGRSTDGFGLFGLLRGGVAMHAPFLDEIMGGPLSGMFIDFLGASTDMGALPPAAEDAAHLNKLSKLWLEGSTVYSREEQEMFTTEVQVLKNCFGMRETSSLPSIACALIWPGLISTKAMEMILARDAVALVILGHYCVLLDRVEDTWWVEGEATALLSSIVHILGEQCKGRLEWPIKEVFK